MKYHVLYNPLAGSGDIKEQADDLSVIYGDELIYRDLTEIESYEDLFSDAGTDDVFILCGGDGTLNRFANATADVELTHEILYCALGTGNDFLRDLEKETGDNPFSINEYLKNLPTVSVNGKSYRFINNVGFGIDGYCCEVGDELKRTRSKQVNYTAIAIKGLLFHYQPTNATVTVDGVEHHYERVWLAPTMKGRFYGGGMMAAPGQDRCDPEGKLSVMIFYGGGRLRTLMAFPSIFKGEHVNQAGMVAIHEGSDISVKFDRPTPLQIDGETILGVTEYRATARVEAKSTL